VFAALLNASTALVCAALASLAWMYGFDAVHRVESLRSMQLEHTRMAREAYETRLQALQARIEPRFLFDALAAIEIAYEGRYENGQQAIDDLISYLRAALPAIDRPTSSLSAELQLAATWLRVARAIHGPGFQYVVAVQDDAGTVAMPPMIVLPLVQDAVACAHARHACTVTVRTEHVADSMRLVVICTPASKALDASPDVASLRKRLAMVYGDAASLNMVGGARHEYRAEMEICT
jgi:LytS/YehU family sensor histidine kinase